MHTDERGFIYFLGGHNVGFVNGQALFTINLQKIDSIGNFKWDSLGIALDTLHTNNFIVEDVAVEDDYALIAWPQIRDSVWDIRSQVLRGNGSSVLPGKGLWISEISSQKTFQSMVQSRGNSNILIWADNRPLSGIYAQRIDTAGCRIWDQNDIPLVLQSIGGLRITSDGKGGCILAGFRESDFTVRAQQVSINGGLGEVITHVEVGRSEQLPEVSLLFQNYPNPFNSTTAIVYELSKSTYAELALYNLLGQRLRTMEAGFQQAGMHKVFFDSYNLSSGAYLYELRTSEAILQRKLTILK